MAVIAFSHYDIIKKPRYVYACGKPVDPEKYVRDGIIWP